VTVTWVPAESVPQQPATESVVMTDQPRLTSAAVGDPGGAMEYWFRVGTSPDPNQGQVINSGWIGTPDWTIPAGSLLDGVTYYWRVITHVANDCAYCVRASGQVNKFRVNLRLGQQSVSPMQSAGPVAVNLANGNMTTTIASPTMAAVGGPVGVTYSYNSRLPNEAGLRGYYYDQAAWDTGSPPKMVRKDPQVSFNWVSGSPTPSVPADNFRVRWLGYVTVPTAGNWNFSACVDDGIRIWINGTLRLDAWSPHPYNCLTGWYDTLTAGQTVPIKIEYYEGAGNAAIELRATNGVDYNGPIPAGWLSESAQVLPQGWKLSVGGSIGLTYDRAIAAPGNLILQTPTGAVEPYMRVGDDYVPVGGGHDVVVPIYYYGVFFVHAQDGNTYFFDALGRLVVVYPAADIGKPAAPKYAYDGLTQRLRTITDPVSACD